MVSIFTARGLDRALNEVRAIGSFGDKAQAIACAKRNGGSEVVERRSSDDPGRVVWTAPKAVA